MTLGLMLMMVNTLFCVCKQPNNPSEPYAQCGLCKDWFHPVCVGYKSVEDIAAISPWYCPPCSMDDKATDSAQKDKIKRRLSFGRELPCSQQFCVNLTREEWSAINPDDREGYRVLKKGWTDIISHKIAVNKKCIKSRKAKRPYWRGIGCTSYLLSIAEDPNITEGDINVHVTVQGEVWHSCDEQHTQHCRKPDRHKLKGKLGEFTPMLVHTKQLANADEDKLLAGNVQDVKSVTVLQKISSEKNLRNRLDRDVFMECFELQQKQDVEKPSSKIKHSSIQYIVMSPFVVHSYSESQLHVLQDLQKNKSCLLYLDATGSVVARPHPSSPPTLYYALCIPCHSTTKSVAEMLTSDQITATILHWLTCLRRDYYKLFKKHFKPQKVETDFSCAMIHAVVQALNIISVQEYVKLCFQMCIEQQSVQLTIIYLCCSHAEVDKHEVVQDAMQKGHQQFFM
ncbi:uncharacterized protein LOC121894086 isoform X2 [Thunnus maccoyii]|uniref:uncharacterized protein LOC121894086 isoform X2 n=1 Tax=Thunnus maccoyii TaxID=8240 RepID=UPI001C4AC9E2|nr:uncharacterized protein LOC121894086 isoform X2 [Thunnus maccoyii]